MELSEQIKNFKTHEPYAVGDGTSSIPFLKLIPKTSKTVLVIGCGEGQEVLWLQEQGFQATGITNNPKEVETGRKKYKVNILQADMHEIPGDKKYDAIFASNVLEHSVAPFLALKHWRTLLKNNGLLILVMPSKEWLPEYYHFSVLTHSQTKDLLYKSGFEVLAGPEMKAKIKLPQGSDIFHDLGRLWGHYDGYVARKSDAPVKKFAHGNPEQHRVKDNLLRSILKIPYNKIRIWRTRNHKE